MERKIHYKKKFLAEDIYNKCREYDFSDPNSILVLNGGTGGGKTTALMLPTMREILQERIGEKVKILFLQSRAMTREQLLEEYSPCIDNFEGIEVKHYNYVEKHSGSILQDFNFLVIDECHSLFADYYTTAGGYLADWIKRNGHKIHLIFITATDQPFQELATKYFTNFSMEYLFPDYTEYIANLFVKNVTWLRSGIGLFTLLKRKKDFLMKNGEKGIIFCPRANQAIQLAIEFSQMGYPSAFYVSLHNATLVEEDTSIALFSQYEKESLSDLLAENNRPTIRQSMEIQDLTRKQFGKEGIVDAVRKKRIPSDIQLLFCTNTLQEGVSFSEDCDIRFMVIEEFSDIGVLQKQGRYRGNLELLYIYVNSSRGLQAIQEEINNFEEHRFSSEEVLAAIYKERQKGNRKEVVQSILYNKEEDRYFFNEAGYLYLRRCFEFYKKETETAKFRSPKELLALIQNNYGFLSPNEVRIESWNEVKGEDVDKDLRVLIEDWRNIPLNKEKQEEFVNQCVEIGLRGKDGRKDIGFSYCKRYLEEKGICNFLDRKKATKENCLVFPFLNYREYYYQIV